VRPLFLRIARACLQTHALMPTDEGDLRLMQVWNDILEEAQIGL
jgi:hypothetical protein